MYMETTINVMGEIETMQPLSIINEDDFEYNMHISATGVVVEEDRANATFVLHILQFTMGSPASDEIVIRGFLMQSPKWPNPTEGLPVLKSIINIGGTLQWFNTYSPSLNHTTTCAVVNVGKMCYQWKPPAKATTNATSASFQPKGKMAPWAPSQSLVCDNNQVDFSHSTYPLLPAILRCIIRRRLTLVPRTWRPPNLFLWRSTHSPGKFDKPEEPGFVLDGTLYVGDGMWEERCNLELATTVMPGNTFPVRERINTFGGTSAVNCKGVRLIQPVLLQSLHLSHKSPFYALVGDCCGRLHRFQLDILEPKAEWPRIPLRIPILTAGDPHVPIEMSSSFKNSVPKQLVAAKLGDRMSSGFARVHFWAQFFASFLIMAGHWSPARDLAAITTE
ncbi:hypothetical protein EI94DRAFT_1701507 [Lactarius quietus]|nr:hypothetical protein EI94DRAFT_1701507 [Lactarius quietus]